VALASDTRQRLIEAAFQRLYNEGFRNVAIDQILADVGISKTAFYKHFESKDDLLLAALENHQRKMEDEFCTFVRRKGGDSPAGQLWALFDLVQNITESEHFHGCVFVNVAIEFPLPHEPAHAVAVKSKEAIQRIVEDLAEQAGAGDPKALAEELCLIMEGAYVTRHVSCKPQTIAIARRLAERAIVSHIGAGGNLIEVRPSANEAGASGGPREDPGTKERRRTGS
jgi:AcrR family transcriptional regulator